MGQSLQRHKAGIWPISGFANGKEDLIATGQAVEMLTFLALMPEVAGGVEEDVVLLQGPNRP